MGQLHNELRRGPLSKALSAAIGDTRSSGLERYGETLEPIIDLWSRPEWALLLDEALLGGVLSQAAVAAEFNFHAVTNPTAIPQLVVVEAAVLRSANTVEYNAGITASGPVLASAAQTLQAAVRDSRRRTLGRTVIAAGTDAAALLANSEVIQTLRIANDTDAEVQLFPVVLSPGFAYVIQALTVNTQLEVSWQIRERLAFPGELE